MVKNSSNVKNSKMVQTRLTQQQYDERARNLEHLFDTCMNNRKKERDQGPILCFKKYVRLAIYFYILCLNGLPDASDVVFFPSGVVTSDELSIPKHTRMPEFTPPSADEAAPVWVNNTVREGIQSIHARQVEYFMETIESLKTSEQLWDEMESREVAFFSVSSHMKLRPWFGLEEETPENDKMCKCIDFYVRFAVHLHSDKTGYKCMHQARDETDDYIYSNIHGDLFFVWMCPSMKQWDCYKRLVNKDVNTEWQMKVWNNNLKRTDTTDTEPRLKYLQTQHTRTISGVFYNILESLLSQDEALRKHIELMKNYVPAIRAEVLSMRNKVQAQFQEYQGRLEAHVSELLERLVPEFTTCLQRFRQTDERKMSNDSVSQDKETPITQKDTNDTTLTELCDSDHQSASGKQENVRTLETSLTEESTDSILTSPHQSEEASIATIRTDIDQLAVSVQPQRLDMTDTQILQSVHETKTKSLTYVAQDIQTPESAEFSLQKFGQTTERNTCNDSNSHDNEQSATPEEIKDISLAEHCDSDRQPAAGKHRKDITLEESVQKGPAENIHTSSHQSEEASLAAIGVLIDQITACVQSQKLNMTKTKILQSVYETETKSPTGATQDIQTERNMCNDSNSHGNEQSITPEEMKGVSPTKHRDSDHQPAIHKQENDTTLTESVEKGPADSVHTSSQQSEETLLALIGQLTAKFQSLKVPLTSATADTQTLHSAHEIESASSAVVSQDSQTPESTVSSPSPVSEEIAAVQDVTQLVQSQVASLENSVRTLQRCFVCCFVLFVVCLSAILLRVWNIQK